MKKWYYILISIWLIGFSCKEHTTTKEEATQLSSLGVKLIPIDNETNFAFLKPTITSINATEHLSFYNSNTRSIYIHNENQLVQKVMLEKEGPNQIKGSYIKGYYLHNLDSIFINAREFIYLIDKTGAILNKIELPQKKEARRFYSGLEVNFNTGTYFRNSILYTNIEIPVPEYDESNPIRGEINMETGIIENDYIEKRSIFHDYETMIATDTALEKHGGYIGVSAQTVTDFSSFFVTSSIHDSIYEYENNILKNTYYVANPEFPSQSYKDYYDRWDIKTDNGISMSSKPYSKPYFSELAIDPNKKHIYRVLIHGKEEVIDVSDQDDTSKSSTLLPSFKKSRIIGASLFKFTIQSKKVIEYIIPIDQVNPSNFFINKTGVYFKSKAQEDENELRYDLLLTNN